MKYHLKQVKKMKSHLSPNIQKLLLSSHTVIANFLSAEEVDYLDNNITFDTDGTACIVDNSANIHIWNNREDFTTFRSLSSFKVATIGGANHHCSAIGNRSLKWTDVNNQLHNYIIKDVLYFPGSPVNIFSVTQFANQLDDKVPPLKL